MGTSLCAIEVEKPRGLFVGGNLFPHEFASLEGAKGKHSDFLIDVIVAGFRFVRDILGGDYPKVFVIMGNDDLKAEELAIWEIEREGLWQYVHRQRTEWAGRTVTATRTHPQSRSG